MIENEGGRVRGMQEGVGRCMAHLLEGSQMQPPDARAAALLQYPPNRGIVTDGTNPPVSRNFSALRTSLRPCSRRASR